MILVDSVCKDGWSVFENSCYKFYQADKQDWDGAQSTCVNEGMFSVLAKMFSFFLPGLLSEAVYKLAAAC